MSNRNNLESLIKTCFHELNRICSIDDKKNISPYYHIFRKEYDNIVCLKNYYEYLKNKFEKNFYNLVKINFTEINRHVKIIKTIISNYRKNFINEFEFMEKINSPIENIFKILLQFSGHNFIFRFEPGESIFTEIDFKNILTEIKMPFYTFTKLSDYTFIVIIIDKKYLKKYSVVESLKKTSNNILGSKNDLKLLVSFYDNNILYQNNMNLCKI